MFRSYLQEIAFDEITLLGQSLKVMAGPLHSLLSPPTPGLPLILSRTRRGTRKVDRGGPTELGGPRSGTCSTISVVCRYVHWCSCAHSGTMG